MSDIAIKVENISKLYKLGEVGTGSFKNDLRRIWSKINGKGDPFKKLGVKNVRDKKNDSEWIWALKDINFEVQKGEILGIIGRNGAGKSTILKILSQITSPTTGKIIINGKIASLLEVGTGFHPELTGRDNIFLNGSILGMNKNEIKRKFDEIVDFSGVEAFIDTPVKRYSSGMYVRLAFAVAAHLEPEILIIDEVLSVGDFDFQKKALGKMQKISSSEGRTVIFVSHNIPAVRNLCSSGLLFVNGEIMHSGSSESVIDNYLTTSLEYNSKSLIKITNENRVLNLKLTVEFIEVEIMKPPISKMYAVNEEIVLELKIKGNEDVDNFRFGYSIFGIDETNVGTFFSKNEFNIKKNEEKTIKIIVNNHQLAKGQYYFDFSVGVGNEIVGVKEFDYISKTIFFEILYIDSSKKEMILQWDKNWGKVNFVDSKIYEI
ncbi:MAG: ABC transporter ATP-binding protein [Chitinophagaceae bacterium]|nr:ABC transporter ATP-binding protein [Chitinophagaceae bacterium]